MEEVWQKFQENGQEETEKKKFKVVDFQEDQHLFEIFSRMLLITHRVILYLPTIFDLWFCFIRMMTHLAREHEGCLPKATM